MDSLTRAQYLEQIKRDMAVLREDPIYHSPSKGFYAQRIRRFREDLLKGNKP